MTLSKSILLNGTAIVFFAAILVFTGCDGRRPSGSPEGRTGGAGSSTGATVLQSWASNTVPLQIVARVHWRGTKDFNSVGIPAALLSIWELPETEELKNRAIRRIAGALAAELSNDPNDATNWVRIHRMVNDVLVHENYFQMGKGEDAWPYCAWAIRMDRERWITWKTNFADMLEPLHHDGQTVGVIGKLLVQMDYSNGWGVLGFSPQVNPLFQAFMSRFRSQSSSPYVWSTNYWLEIDTDVTHWPTAIKPPTAVQIPRIGVSIVAEGEELRVDAELNFATRLALSVSEWQVPTQLIDGSLSSFTAIRGLTNLLDRGSAWQRVTAERPPEQLFAWALRGLQMQTYMAAPLPDASNVVSRITEKVLSLEDPWGGTNELVGFQRSSQFQGFEWRGLPYLWPFLKTAEANGRAYMYAGTFPMGDVYPIAASTLDVLNPTNLLYYDWEMTSVRAEQWLYIGQFARLVTQKAQLPLDSTSVCWLKAAAPKLRNSLTLGTITGPSQLSFVRKSTLGLTGVELQLLCDWLESPAFPRGFHTMLAAPEPLK